MRLIKSNIDAIEASDAPCFYWDDALKGFGIRVMPSGVITFVARYRIGKGRRAQQRLDKLGRYGAITPDQARTEAKRRLSQATLGQDPLGDARARLAEMTVAELIELWAVRGAPIHRRTGRMRKPISVEQDIRQMRVHVVPLIGKRRLSDLRPVDFNSLRTSIRLGETKGVRKTKLRGVQRVRGGDGTAIRVLACFKSVLGWAEDQEFVEYSPGRKVRLPQAKKQNYQPLRPEQFVALGQALQQLHGEYPDAVEMILLIALSGARKGEIEKLKYSEVMNDGRTLCLVDAKTEGRVIYLGDAAARILGNRKPIAGSPYVFPASRGEGYYQHMPKIWKRALALAGLPPTLKRKDLRHSFATHGSGIVPSPHMQQLLGHANIATTEHYYHTQALAIRQSAQEVENFIAQMIFPPHMFASFGGTAAPVTLLRPMAPLGA